MLHNVNGEEDQQECFNDFSFCRGDSASSWESAPLKADPLPYNVTLFDMLPSFQFNLDWQLYQPQRAEEEATPQAYFDKLSCMKKEEEEDKDDEDYDLTDESEVILCEEEVLDILQPQDID